VSWNLMIGKNPLWVAKQHGHSVTTMFRVYSAWAEGAEQATIQAIKRPPAPALEAASRPPPPQAASGNDAAWGDLAAHLAAAVGSKSQAIELSGED
jgi:hypothetical protein